MLRIYFHNFKVDHTSKKSVASWFDCDLLTACLFYRKGGWLWLTKTLSFALTGKAFPHHCSSYTVLCSYSTVHPNCFHDRFHPLCASAANMTFPKPTSPRTRSTVDAILPCVMCARNLFPELSCCIIKSRSIYR